MAEELVMPRLSDTMERGTIARWLKHEGDTVIAGDVVAEIETDKATMEYQSDIEGVLLRILVGDGEIAELGAPIGLVGAVGEDVSGFTPANGAPPATADLRDDGASAPPTAHVAAGGGAIEGIKASPVARRMAQDAGLDLRNLTGSGPDGRIVRIDIERALTGEAPPAVAAPAAAAAPPAAPTPPAAAQAVPSAPSEAESFAPSTMLRAVASRMVASKTQVPHFYLEREIDMQAALAFRAELNAAWEGSGDKLSINDLVVRACALALQEHPTFHRSWYGDRIVQHSSSHVGVAVALEEGLIVPVVRGADALSLRELSGVSRDLAQRARAGTLHQREIEGGTFTVSNLGMLDVTNFQAVINPPEPGILAVGAAVERPVARGGEVVIRPIMSVSLSVDHRAASGADGARLLQTIVQLIEHPLGLIA